MDVPKGWRRVHGSLPGLGSIRAHDRYRRRGAWAESALEGIIGRFAGRRGWRRLVGNQSQFDERLYGREGCRPDAAWSSGRRIYFLDRGLTGTRLAGSNQRQA